MNLQRKHKKKKKRPDSHFQELRFGTLNVRTLSAKAANDGIFGEFASTWDSYRLSVVALQEVRRPGLGSIVDTATGYSIHWNGPPDAGSNGVGFALSRDFQALTTIDGTSQISFPVVPPALCGRVMVLRLDLRAFKTFKGNPTFTDHRYLHLVSVYAPNAMGKYTPEDHDQFYDRLIDYLHVIHSAQDRLMILGDFNARTGPRTPADTHLRCILGRFGQNHRNANGRRLLDFAHHLQLRIINTWYQKKRWHTHMFALAKTKVAAQVRLDYILYDNRFAQMDVIDCNVVDVQHTDHALVYCKTKLRLHRYGFHDDCRDSSQRKKPIHLPELARKDIQIALAANIETFCTSLPAIGPDTDIPAIITRLCDHAYDCALNLCGEADRTKQQDIYSIVKPQLQTEIRNKRRAYHAWRSAVSNDQTPETTKSRLKRNYKRHEKIWKRKRDQLMEEYSKQICSDLTQCVVDFNMYQYQLIVALFDKEVVGKQPPVLADADGNLVRTTQGILEVLAGHFSTLLNNVADTIDFNVINELPGKILSPDQVTSLNEPFAISELCQALACMPTRKATGQDQFPIDIWKAVVQVKPNILEYLLQLINQCFVNATPLQEWKDIVLVPIHKGKGLSTTNADNYRGIALISHIGKLYAKMLDIRLQTLCEKIDLFPENQYGFRHYRGVQDPLFIARFLQQAGITQDMDIYWCFVDLAKAYDTIPRDCLWLGLEKIGIPPLMLNNIKALHTGMKGRVKFRGAVSDAFDVTVGVRQGDVLAPTLFNIYFSLVFQVMEQRIAADPTIDISGVTLFCDEEASIWDPKHHFHSDRVFQCELEGCTFSSTDNALRVAHQKEHRRLLRAGHSDCELSSDIQRLNDLAHSHQIRYQREQQMKFRLWYLLFADDAAFFASNPKELQDIITLFHEVSRAFGLRISVKKTEILIQKRKKRKNQPPDPEPVFYVGNDPLKNVKHFKYLGGMLNSKGCLKSNELPWRIGKAIGKYNSFRTQIFRNKHLKLHVKVRLYRVIVISTLLYDCNNWFVPDKVIQPIVAFDRDHLHSIMKLSRGHHIAYEELLEQLSTTHIRLTIIYRRLRWLGKMVRMTPNRIARKILFSNLYGGTRNLSCLAIPMQRQIKEDLLLFGFQIDPDHEDYWHKFAQKPEIWEQFLKDKTLLLNEQWINSRLGTKGSPEDKRKLTNPEFIFHNKRSLYKKKQDDLAKMHTTPRLVPNKNGVLQEKVKCKICNNNRELTLSYFLNGHQKTDMHQENKAKDEIHRRNALGINHPNPEPIMDDDKG